MKLGSGVGKVIDMKNKLIKPSQKKEIKTEDESK